MISTKTMTLLVCGLIVLAAPLYAVSLQSPDGRVAVETTLEKSESVRCEVSLNGMTVVTVHPLDLSFKNQPPLGNDLEIVDLRTSTVDERWNPVWGTHSKVHNHASQAHIIFKERTPAARSVTLTIRAYKDGVAFQYGFPPYSPMKAFRLTDERTGFRFTGNPTVWAGRLDSYTTHQETEYTPALLRTLPRGCLLATPLLVKVSDHCWAGVTEAGLDDWAGMYLTPGAESNTLISDLSPRPDEPNVRVIGSTPAESPWRVILLGEKPGDLIESNLILNLNDPCEIADPSWIRPGISAWDRWWCGSYAPDFPGPLRVNNASMKYFIDFAAEMGWEYQLVDWEWYGPPFDPEKPFGTAGNPAADLTRSIDEIDIPELVDYAAQKGVKILVWLDWENADRQMEKAFPLYEKWGVAGVKVDFMARDDQEMVRFYHRLVKLAARHRLVVDFHGAYKPTGFRRTYPNLLTREGVLGNEYNKWSDRITPEHNVILPFTRMLAGPMDYTPGGFRNKTPDTFRIVGGDAPGPFVMTTRAHQLAQFVVYESPLQVACDSPYNYRNCPAGLDFLKIVPTVWEDTRVLDGYPGDFIVMARKSGTSWFIGAMTDESARTIAIPLSFLNNGRYTIQIWGDPEEAGDYPDRILVREITRTDRDTLELSLAGAGGAVARIAVK